MNKITTPSNKNKAQAPPEVVTPKPTTIAMLRCFARTYNPSSSSLKRVCNTSIQ
ncbi:MAG: hypothetical protein RR346_05730 [Bacteroidales bacterium]